MSSFETWEPALRRLADGVLARTVEALATRAAEELGRPVAQGAGDLTFGLDVPSEDWIDRWFQAEAAQAPLSLLTEDRGWRHAGPQGALEGFDHGGPRITVDPIDGTRNLMAQLRSAWTVIGFCDPGDGPPRLADVTAGLVSELPPPRQTLVRRFVADADGCRLEELRPDGATSRTARPVRTDDDDRPDHGYFPVFRYDPRLRPALAELERTFFERLAEHEHADLRSVYDDQYISNAGQLVELVRGSYRFCADARALVGRRAGRPTVTSKPYDVAGALLCARAAGVVVTAADGGPLDFPLDATTPVDFVAYVNEATRRRLEPHWLAALAQDA